MRRVEIDALDLVEANRMFDRGSCQKCRTVRDDIGSGLHRVESERREETHRRSRRINARKRNPHRPSLHLNPTEASYLPASLTHIEATVSGRFCTGVHCRPNKICTPSVVGTGWIELTQTARPVQNGDGMTERPFLVFVCVCIVAVTSAARAGVTTRPECGASSSQDMSPMTELKRSHDALSTALRRQVPEWSPEASLVRSRIAHVLAGILDYQQIARRALGRRWDHLTDRQHIDFLSLFAPLTNQALIAAAERNVVVSYDSQTIAGTEATVVVSPKEPSIGQTIARLEYHLYRKCDHWYVYDVVVDGVSLADGYRSQFNRLLQRESFEDLLDLMRRKVNLQASR
jgi:phospholipid transport system substrate-binding protein